ncbi:hypothetical protein D6C86_04849 [Aureobasidium pullulans]|nr:hypothetical protein D6C86_04849 [Aureobasidium pullulans]
MIPQIIEDDRSEVSEISFFKHNDDAVKPSSHVQNINRPVLQSWEGDEYLEHEVAAYARAHHGHLKVRKIVDPSTEESDQAIQMKR